MDDHVGAGGGANHNPRITCVVIGGQGFIGRFLVQRLLRLENWIIRIADSSPSLHVEQKSAISDAVSSGLVSHFQADVRDKSQLVKAFAGSSVVFYAETIDGLTYDTYECYKLLVQGAKNIVTACRESKVKCLIYNSSADVVFDGSHHIRYGNESVNYPLKYEDILLEMKAQAEAIILAANDNDGLLTCAIRPSNVFGPRDTFIMHFLVNQANSFWAKFILGSGDNLSDFTYVENLAHAHVCAAEALVSRNVVVAGKAFFITNQESRNYWQFVSQICERWGCQRPSIRLPTKLLSFMLPMVRWTRSKLGSEPEVTGLLASVQFIIESALFTRTFNCSAAKKHINYSPVVSLEEGIASIVKSLPNLVKDSSRSIEAHFSEPSKADEILGYGKVADILLWRDEMESFSCFLGVSALFYWFILSGRTFISSTAGLLLLANIVLIITNLLPFNLLQKMPVPCFELSEITTRSLLKRMASMWNKWAAIVRSFAQGEDWGLFFKVAVPLYVLKLIISYSFTSLAGGALIFSFTSFFIYEQYEEEIDCTLQLVVIVAKCSFTLLLACLPPHITSFFFDDDDLDEEKHEQQQQPTTKE